MLLQTLLLRQLIICTAIVFLPAVYISAQNTTCAPVEQHDATPAEEAYSQGKYDSAESLYMQAIQQRPHDVALSSALVHTLLHEEKIADASARAESTLTEEPHSAAALTALAEVQLRMGQPWLALQTLETAATAEPCYARTHLIRSRVFRIDSMYASERKELQAAYDIDPHDPDIKHDWLHTVSSANDVTGTEKALATMSNVDADLREKVQISMHSLLTLLSENSQTCQSPPLPSALTLPLMPSLQDAKHITGYQLDVQFPQVKAKVRIDTAASGLYISRALADANGFQHASGAPANTVQVDSVHIGPLEFRNCIVGVSDEPFPDKIDGFIGTDIFAAYLITLDYPEAKLELAPLPPITGQQDSMVPGDRFIAPDMHDYAAVYHRRQYLLVPVMLNKKERRLFALDSGMRLSTMTPAVAHSISKTKLNFTNSLPTTSGATVQVYRDGFDFQFANLSLDNQSGILQYDSAAINQNAGMEVAGLLGFDMLHSLVIHMDYRDGLVKFDSSASSVSTTRNILVATATPKNQTPDDAPCQSYVNQSADQSIDTTIEASVTGWLDSGHLKPGQEVDLKVVHEWITEQCRLSKGATLYGHVVTASSKSSGKALLALVFDHGDCFGQTRKELSLRIIGLVGANDDRKALHDAVPTEVSGGSRQISTTAAVMGDAADQNLNPGGPPHTVHLGIVSGLHGIEMTPEGGPQCSTLLTSTDHSVHLGNGSEFILTMQSTH